MSPRSTALAFVLFLAAVGGAAAQTAPGAAGSNDVVPEKQAPPLNATPSLPPGGSLSDKLDKSNGVITPPSVDPAMPSPQAPSTGGTMP